MREIAAVELSLIAEELKPVVGAFLRKFYEVSKGSFRMNLYSPSGEGKVDIFISLNKTINISSYTEHVEEPTAFAMSIRKRIEGKRLVAVSQVGTDRILTIDFSGDEGYKLIIEMFGKGNIILVNKLMNIESAYRFIKYKDREIRRGSVYSFPTGDNTRIGEMDESYVSKKMSELKEGEQIIRELSRCFNFGPLYIEDIILRCGFDPRSPLNNGHYGAIKKGICDFLARIKHPSPLIYERGSEYTDYSVVPIKKYEALHAVKFNTVSEMLDHFYLEERKHAAAGASAANEGKRKEIEMNISKQKKIAEEAKAKVEEYTKSANAIFKHINEINQLIMMLNEDEKMPVSELNKNLNSIKVKGVDLKNKKVKIIISEE